MIAEEDLRKKPLHSIVILTMHDEEQYLQELFKNRHARLAVH